MPIDRCCCIGLTFKQLLLIAQEKNLTLEQLMAETRCCGQCGTCKPYVAKTLKTGQTSFTEIIPFSPNNHIVRK